MDFRDIFAIGVLLVASTGTTYADPCPTGCSCSSREEVTCSDIGITQPPVGYWPDVLSLTLYNNRILDLDPYGLTGFPNLRNLSIRVNHLQELDLNTLATAQYLERVTVNFCYVSRVVPLEASLQMLYLQYLDLTSNSIATLDEGIFSSEKFPQLETLYLSNNRIVLPKVHPLIESATLKYLHVDHTFANDISSETFKGLPKLVDLNIKSSQVSDFGDALTYLPSLVNLYIGYNPYKEIRNGTFPRLSYVTLDASELETMETAALANALSEGGIVDISNTPMACQCNYEDLYWWANAMRIRLYARCGNKECEFSRKKL